MNRLTTLTGLVLLAVLAAPDALADKHKSNSKRMKEASERTELQAEQKQAAKMREKERELASERAEEAREAAEERAEQERERAEEMRELAEERAEQEREGDVGDDLGKGQENAATRGSEKAQEMRARRDERKRIKEEYKAGRDEAGDEVADLEIDEDSEDKARKEKKPWWKFWGD